MTKPKGQVAGASALAIRASSFIRHSSFVIRICNHGRHGFTSETELARASVFARHRGGTRYHHKALQKHAVRAHQGHDAISRGKMGQQPAGPSSWRARAGAL